MAELLTLRVNGKNYGGWTSVQIGRSLDAIADTFDLGISTAISSQFAEDFDIVDGDQCELIYDGETLISGYVDTVDANYNASAFSVTVNGRSRTGDLVDCSAIHKPWRNTSMLKIAEELCAPFGIAVSNALGEEPPKESYFKLSNGETVFDALDRLARTYAVRVRSYPDGSVYFTRTGAERYPDIVIAPGLNVVSGGFVKSMEERYSQYIFRAQYAADDETYGAAASAAKYELSDEGVDRYRPLLVHSDTQPRNAAGRFTKGKKLTPLESAALWERNTRAGRARKLKYEVADPEDMARSWQTSKGILWEPNIVVSVRDPMLGVEGEFLITDVTLTLGAGGTRTALSLTHPSAYDIQDPPKGKKRKGFSF